jgi:hypothetical protein
MTFRFRALVGALFWATATFAYHFCGGFNSRLSLASSAMQSRTALFIQPLPLLGSRSSGSVFFNDNRYFNNQRSILAMFSNDQQDQPQTSSSPSQPIGPDNMSEYNNMPPPPPSTPQANGVSNSRMVPSSSSSKLEQFAKLRMLESRLKKLQEDQMGKEENYQQRIRNVMEEME